MTSTFVVPRPFVYSLKLVNKFSLVFDLLERGEDFGLWYARALFRADRCVFGFEFHFDCQYTRYCFDGLFDLRCSRVSRHAFDADYRLLHVRGELVVRRNQAGERLGKEQKHDCKHGYGPEHDLVESHYPGAAATNRCRGAALAVR